MTKEGASALRRACVRGKESALLRVLSQTRLAFSNPLMSAGVFKSCWTSWAAAFE